MLHLLSLPKCRESVMWTYPSRGLNEVQASRGEMKALIPVEVIEQRILLIRGQKVILDAASCNVIWCANPRP
jgi:hypothetical protein